MEELKRYLLPYLLSNIIFVLCIVGAIRKAILVRAFLAGFFLWAGIFNIITAIRSPEVYLDYGKLTLLSLYQNFIYGYFSQHIEGTVITIAVGQLLIFAGLVLNKAWTKVACAGGVIMGLAIAPLGIGSAFPATVSMAIAFFIIMKKYDHDFIWNWYQYQ